MTRKDDLIAERDTLQREIDNLAPALAEMNAEIILIELEEGKQRRLDNLLKAAHTWYANNCPPTDPNGMGLYAGIRAYFGYKDFDKNSSIEDNNSPTTGETDA